LKLRWFWIGTVICTTEKGRINRWDIKPLVKRRWMQKTGPKTDSALHQGTGPPAKHNRVLRAPCKELFSEIRAYKR
jgi:hypothetical protein